MVTHRCNGAYCRRTDQVVGDFSGRVFLAVEAEVDFVVLGGLELTLDHLVLLVETDDEEARSLGRLLPLHLRLVFLATALARRPSFHLTEIK